MDFFTRLNVFFRSFLLQAGWNFERMQNMGFVFALAPALKKIWKDKEELKQAMLRHIKPFNTQPYMASFSLGQVLRLEEKMAASPVEKRGEIAEQLAEIKKASSSALAAIGDTLFWGALKPAGLGISLAVFCLLGFYGWLFLCPDNHGRLGRDYEGWKAFTGLAAGVIVYNIFTIGVRWRGLKVGYDCVDSKACGLDSINWQRLIGIFRILCFFTIGTAMFCGLVVTLLRFIGVSAVGGACFSPLLPNLMTSSMGGDLVKDTTWVGSVISFLSLTVPFAGIIFSVIAKKTGKGSIFAYLLIFVFFIAVYSMCGGLVFFGRFYQNI